MTAEFMSPMQAAQSLIHSLVKFLLDLDLNAGPHWLDRENGVALTHDGLVAIHDGLQAHRIWIERPCVFGVCVLIEQDGAAYKVDAVEGHVAAALVYLNHVATRNISFVAR